MIVNAGYRGKVGRPEPGLPELAGTWVLNERLYAPENRIDVTMDFTAGRSPTEQHFNVERTVIDATDLRIRDMFTGYVILYLFAKNTWKNANYKYWVFPAGATASDEFRAWLANNATKQ